MRKLIVSNWAYEDYLAITDRKDSPTTQKRWLDVIALINTKHYESIDNEIRETVQWVDDLITKEEK